MTDHDQDPGITGLRCNWTDNTEGNKKWSQIASVSTVSHSLLLWLMTEPLPGQGSTTFVTHARADFVVSQAWMAKWRGGPRLQTWWLICDINHPAQLWVSCLRESRGAQSGRTAPFLRAQMEHEHRLPGDQSVTCYSPSSLERGTICLHDIAISSSYAEWKKAIFFTWDSSLWKPISATNEEK